MIPFPLAQAVSAVEGTFIGDGSLLKKSVADVVIDSRAATPGALYVPIRGEHFDGHAFIGMARENGALCVLSSVELPQGPYILVKDTLSALHRLAEFYRSLVPIPLIGVTGSVGKTSIKEMLSCVLSQHYRVLKTKGNQNNLTGLPQTIFSIGREHEIAVVEMGTNHFGEIRQLSRIARPNICVLANIGVAHIEFFGSREGILKGKSEMLEYMQPGGTVVVNGDDDMLTRITPALRFGFGEDNDVRAVELTDLGLAGTEFTAVCAQGQRRMIVPAPGRHMVLNALCAITVGLTLGLTLEELSRGVEAFAPTAGRMDVRRTASLTLLDDSYNANPTSVMAAIDVLEKVEGRRVCVLGDMLELGKQSAEFHEVVGMYAAMHGIDLIVCVGPQSEQTFMGAHELAPRRARYFETQDSLLSILPQLLHKSDTVLVKASRGMHLEKTVELLSLLTVE